MNPNINTTRQRQHEFDVTITESRPEDISEVSKLHMSSFQGEFLHSFGDEFLNIYYENYLNNPDALLLVAKTQNKIIGFVAGAVNQDKMIQYLYRKKFFYISWLALKKFLLSDSFRRYVIKRKFHVGNALMSRFFPKMKKQDVGSGKKNIEIDQKTCSLLSIAVLDNYRGCGIALNLVSAFETAMKNKGVSKCELCVKRENSRAISFYKKAGWQKGYETRISINFKKKL